MQEVLSKHKESPASGSQPAVFEDYARLYDLYYAHKDYPAEADFVLELAEHFSVRPTTLLDLGCGTGRHLAEFIARGLKCDGCDLSARMLEQARSRLSGTGVRLSQADVCEFRSDRRYDLVVAMFAVMSYLTTNERLVRGLMTAGRHLRRGGLFLFDGWFGPAVLAQKPEPRRHEYRRGDETVVRQASPFLDVCRQVVSVRYAVEVRRGDSTIEEIHEEHEMRFLFVQEMAYAMERAGLELALACPFLEPERELTTGTWNVTFVGRKQ